MTSTPRERLIQDIGDCFKGECAKVARGEKSTQADGERGVFSDASLADYLLSHGWIESGQAGEAPTGESPSVVAGDTRNTRSVGPASPAPSLEARETWWLIEWPPKANVNEFSLWLAQRQGGGCHAGSDVNQAIRFRSRGDAESVVVRGLLKAEHGWAGAIVTEHMWMDGDLTALEGQYAGTWAHPLRTVNPPAPVEAREPLSDAEVDRIGFKVEPEFRKLFDAFERCNGLEPERENLIRAVASALRGEG